MKILKKIKNFWDDESGMGGGSRGGAYNYSPCGSCYVV